MSPETADIDEDVNAYRAALAGRPPGHSKRVGSLGKLAKVLFTRFEKTSQVEDLEECIDLNRELLAHYDPSHPNRSGALIKLAIAVSTRFERTEKMEDLEEAVDLYRAALALRPPGHAGRAAALNNLANAVRLRFEQSSHIEDLDEGVDLHRSALALLPPDDRNRSWCLNDLAYALRTLFKQTGRMEDLEEAVSLYRAALSLCSPRHPNRSTSLTNLAESLLDRFKQTSRIEDLHECVELHRGALALRPQRHPDRSQSLSRLSNALGTRFHQTGRMEDLDERINMSRLVLVLRPDGHPERSTSLTLLSTGVLDRYKQTGQMEDFKECVELSRAALALRPPGHPNRSTTLNNLANALSPGFRHTRQLEYLEEAISLYREALDLHPPGHRERSTSLNNLAVSVFDRFRQTRRLEDLEEAVDLYRAALGLRPPGHPDRSTSLSMLSNAVLDRFKHAGQMKDLEEAVDLQRAALALRPVGHPQRSVSLESLASALYLRSSRIACAEDLTESFDLFRSATEDEFSSVGLRFRASLLWATLARECSHPLALDAYQAALSLLERFLAPSPTFEMQHRRLNREERFSTLALDAASYAIGVGKYVEAVEMLEQGRALLWSQLYKLRTPLDELQQVDKALADQFLETSNALETLSTLAANAEDDRMALNLESETPAAAVIEDRIGRLLNRKRHLEATRETLIERIRNLPGGSFRNFFRATPFDMLKAAANDGPVIVAIAAKSRCDALIILETHDSPVCVPIGGPDAYEALSTLSTRLLVARRSLKTEEKEYNNELRETLKALWKVVVGPVTKKLLELGIKPGSRIWWCPTSVLGTLPLHAAGVISPRLPDSPKAIYLSDIFISSYTPTLMGLIRARSFSQSLVHKQQSMLVVWNDRNLRTVREEVKSIRELESSVYDLHCNDLATSERVAEELKKHSFLHIACHGQLVPEKPFESSFVLFGDARLSLLNIVRSQLPNAELAFLSACHSAELTSDGGYDEVLHLAAAMQVCGFRSVIGTMWEMADIDGPHLARKFYKVLFAADGEDNGSKRAARAIRDAAKSLRKIEGMTLERWVNYVHFGV